jgi:membrane-associated protease RseP (regulator of RpoE activity)
VLLLLLTFLTTTAVGARMARNFENNLPAFTEADLGLGVGLIAHPSEFAKGLPFSITLLLILLAHEMGHYGACQYYGVHATLPFFLPAPTLIGTFGAFIRIRSPIYTKRALFDIGIAGPLAGFAVLLPALGIGLAYSKIIPGIAERGELVFGVPLLQKAIQSAVFPGVPPSDIALHPIARAAWVGILATALNLLPIGQLDGGHILYSFVGKRHRVLSGLFVAALVPIGLIYSYSWLVWAVILLILGMRHPSIQDASDLGAGRRKLGALALAIFLLSFTLAPVRMNDGF